MAAATVNEKGFHPAELKEHRVEWKGRMKYYRCFSSSTCGLAVRRIALLNSSQDHLMRGFTREDGSEFSSVLTIRDK